jgi:hypothetical protein
VFRVGKNDICPPYRPLLGKMTVRYTRTKIYVDSEGDKSVVPYQVVAKDATSVAILIDGYEIYHINFEGKYYWICLGKFRDYYRKIE